jgi:zinc/manganese transport system permease protein
VLAVDDAALVAIAAVATASMLAMAALHRALVVECFDPEFMRATGGPGAAIHAAFLVLLVANLVAAFLALGTLMAVGLMMVPAAAARFWARGVAGMIAVATAIGAASAYLGLVLSFAADLPSGPSIVLVAGIAYAASVLFGGAGGVVPRILPRAHLRG